MAVTTKARLPMIELQAFVSKPISYRHIMHVYTYLCSCFHTKMPSVTDNSIATWYTLYMHAAFIMNLGNRLYKLWLSQDCLVNYSTLMTMPCATLHGLLKKRTHVINHSLYRVMIQMLVSRVLSSVEARNNVLP